MDDKRFDSLAKMVGKGASRRSIFKGLLGLGGTAIGGAVTTDRADARRVFIEPRFDTPEEPDCPNTGEFLCGTSTTCCTFEQCNTTTNTCCTGTTLPCGTGCCDADQCTSEGVCCPANREVCGEICCPDGTCARDGNDDICCDGTLGNNSNPCGLDCCATEAQCCGGECCPSGTFCLTQVFEEGPYVEEETCCPEDQTCDERCCIDGTCFAPPGSGATGVNRECCPADGEICTGTNGTLCCEEDTPDCCVRANGVAICINEATQCCVNADCDDLDEPENCLEGFCPQASQICATRTTCEDDEDCCIGGDNECCPTGDTTQECCGPECCEIGFECCERTIGGVLTLFCINSETQCCDNADCNEFDNPALCLRGVCRRSDQTCEARTICEDDAQCCEGETAVEDGVCCPAEQECCGPECCAAGLECCERTIGANTILVCIDPLTQCCVNPDCDEFDNPALCLRGVCSGITQLCEARDICADDEQCCPGDLQTPGVCIPEDACCTDDDCEGCEVCYEGACISECTGSEICCVRRNQDPICIDPATQCCLNQECVREGDDPECRACQNNVCVSRPSTVSCNQGTGICCDGVCCEEGQVCAEAPNNEVSVAQVELVCCTPLTCADDSLGGLGEPCGASIPDGCGGTIACRCKEGICNLDTFVCEEECADPDFPCGPEEDSDQFCCPAESFGFCCEGAEGECCGGPDGRECDDNGHCCEIGTPFHCSASGAGQAGCCATDCNSLDQCAAEPTTTTVAPTTTTTPPCLDDDDCPDGCQACDTETGTCSSLCFPEPCCTIGPPEEWFCAEGECCPNGIGCDAGEICCDGTCVAGTTCPTTTTTAEPTTTTTAQPTSTTAAPECIVDSDCGDVRCNRCQDDGTCRQAPDGRQGDCPDGSICCEGACEVGETCPEPCIAHADCGDTRCNRCIDNFCQHRADEQPCAGTPAGICCDEVCIVGATTCDPVTTTTTTAPECSDEVSCPEGEVCCEGVCEPGLCCEGEECLIDDETCIRLDLLGNEVNICVCIEGICRPGCLDNLFICDEDTECCSECCLDLGELGICAPSGFCPPATTTTTVAPECIDDDDCLINVDECVRLDLLGNEVNICACLQGICVADPCLDNLLICEDDIECCSGCCLDLGELGICAPSGFCPATTTTTGDPGTTTTGDPGTTTTADPGTTTTLAPVACTEDADCTATAGLCGVLGELQVCACVNSICQAQTVQCIDPDDCDGLEIDGVVCTEVGGTDLCSCTAANVCVFECLPTTTSQADPIICTENNQCCSGCCLFVQSLGFSVCRADNLCNSNTTTTTPAATTTTAEATTTTPEATTTTPAATTTTPAAPVCGDSNCDAGENCANCAVDCPCLTGQVCNPNTGVCDEEQTTTTPAATTTTAAACTPSGNSCTGDAQCCAGTLCRGPACQTTGAARTCRTGC